MVLWRDSLIEFMTGPKRINCNSKARFMARVYYVLNNVFFLEAVKIT